MVDRYELGTALSMAIVVGQIPFSRNLLETRLRLNEPTQQTLLRWRPEPICSKSRAATWC